MPRHFSKYSNVRQIDDRQSNHFQVYSNQDLLDNCQDITFGSYNIAYTNTGQVKNEFSSFTQTRIFWICKSEEKKHDAYEESSNIINAIIDTRSNQQNNNPPAEKVGDAI